MPRYKFCNLSIESNSPLAIPPGDSDDGSHQCTFTVFPDRSFPTTTSDWFDHRPVEAKPALSLARLDTGYLLRFTGLADFVVSTDGARVGCYPLPGTPAVTVRHLFLDQVMPLVMSHQGRLVLHASAVLTPCGAVAFLGHTGSGKSTLAASFCRQGFPVLTDDCLCVDESAGRLDVTPSYGELRLWPDARSAVLGREPAGPPMAHYSGKTREGPGNQQLDFHDRPVSLHRVYVLALSDDVPGPSPIAIAALSQSQSFKELVRCTHRLDTTDRSRLGAEFGRLTRLAASVPARRLMFPKDFSRLSEVRAVIERDLGDPADS